MSKRKLLKDDIVDVQPDVVTFKDGTIMKSAKNDNLLDLYHKAVRDVLLGDVDKTNPLYAYVKKSFTNMTNKIENENGARSLEKIKDLVTDTQEYLSKGKEDNYDFIEYKISRTFFPWQQNVLKTLQKRNTMLCGRRSGKSYSEAGLAVLHCTKGYDNINGFNKQRSVLVMGLTINKTKDVFWENLIKYADISGMTYKADNASLRITFENGAFIQLVGNNSKTDREKLRGQDYSFIIIDEAQSQQALKYLMVDILGPIIKGRDSTTILSGTGSITAKGYWKDITDGEQAATWNHYTATMKDNPTVPEDALETVLRDNSWTEDDITFRREYLAENIIDTTRIVYPVYHKYDIVPQNEYITKLAIGVDYGVNDYNALVALGLSSNGKIYELETKKFNKSDVSTIVNELTTMQTSLMEKYKIDKRNCIAVADTSDQSISNELWRKKINIFNAYKVDRIQQIFDIREALKRADILVKSTEITEEMGCYIWKYDEETHSVIYETDDDFYHADALAAFRYSVYYLMHEKDRQWKNPLGSGNNA